MRPKTDGVPSRSRSAVLSALEPDAARAQPGTVCSGSVAPPGDDLGPADDDTALRPAEELVAAEEHEVGTGANTLLHDRLFGQSMARQVVETAAADVVDHRQPTSLGQTGQLGDGDRFAKAGDA